MPAGCFTGLMLNHRREGLVARLAAAGQGISYELDLGTLEDLGLTGRPCVLTSKARNKFLRARTVLKAAPAACSV